jgi:hypothetical protein
VNKSPGQVLTENDARWIVAGLSGYMSAMAAIDGAAWGAVLASAFLDQLDEQDILASLRARDEEGYFLYERCSPMEGRWSKTLSDALNGFFLKTPFGATRNHHAFDLARHNMVVIIMDRLRMLTDEFTGSAHRIEVSSAEGHQGCFFAIKTEQGHVVLQVMRRDKPK